MGGFKRLTASYSNDVALIVSFMPYQRTAVI